MNTRSNQILVGIILILLGSFAFIKEFFQLNHGAAMGLLAGFALLLLYRTKHKTWALCLGMYVLCFSLMGIARTWLPPWVFGNFMAGMFFLVPGIIFLVLFYVRNKRGLLVPSAMLIWFAIFLASLYIPPVSGGARFFLCLGCAFVMIHYVGKPSASKLSLCAGVILIVFAALLRGIILQPWALLFVAPGVIAALCIAFGLVIIIRAVRKKN